MSDPVARLKRYLKTRRAEAGETQEAFARRAGVDRSMVSHFLSKRRRPGLDDSFAMEDATAETGDCIPARLWCRRRDLRKTG